MSGLSFTFRSETLTALGSGALFWPAQSLLCVSDLHLGRTERIARTGGQIIPPYENTDTLARLEAHIAALAPRTVICLGDSFDDMDARQSLTNTETEWITRLQAGRHWIWIEGNHDPAPLDLGGAHKAEHRIDALVFRHIAEPDANGEISGHYHPKITVSGRGRGITRPALVFDDNRLILPAFGTYTGGMSLGRSPLNRLFDRPSVILTGDKPRLVQSHAMARRERIPASSSKG